MAYGGLIHEHEDPFAYDPLKAELDEARRDARQDAYDERCVTCSDCGGRWDPSFRRATRTDPVYEEYTECPRCGGERETEMKGPEGDG
jgi:hypothetical protein